MGNRQEKEKNCELISETNLNLPYYLAGLFEGDGYIWVQKQNQGKTEKKHLPRFSITFHKKNLFLAEKFLKFIGSGNIRVKQKQNAIVLYFRRVNKNS